METINVTEKEVQAAFAAAKSEETKQVLTTLFGPPKEKAKPTIDNYKTIKSYEDACEVLGLNPIYSNKNNDIDICQYANGYWIYKEKLPKHIIALIKLETISRALWGRNWEPKPDAHGTKLFYYPCFNLPTNDEIKGLTKKQRNTLLSTPIAGFRCLDTTYRSSFAATYFEFRLCQETMEKAEYFGCQFIELWAEYLRFNF